MPTISYVSVEEHEALKREVAEVRVLLKAYVTSQLEWLTTAQALPVAGIKSRSTLAMSARASAPGVRELGRITYKKEGTTCYYLKSSCIDYAQRKWGQPALNP